MNFWRKRWPKAAVCLSLLIAMTFWLSSICFAIDSVDTSGAIAQAEENLDLAYIKVAEADAAGADVSLLLLKLDTAGGFLSEANSAFRSGDYERAYSSAIDCKTATNGIVDDAARLKMEAEENFNERWFLTRVGSGIAICVILVFAFFGWRMLKNRYLKQVSNVKY